MIWLGLLAAFGGAWLLFPHAVKKFQIGKLRRRCKADRLIAITYDDGPGQQLTGKLLEILKCRGAIATFFLVGHKVDSFSECANRIVNAGHEIGSHSYRHLHAWKRNPVSVFLDIQNGFRVLRSLGPCRLFRAPYGKMTLGTFLQVSIRGKLPSWWTIDSTDTWETPCGVGRIIDQVRSEGGGVILLHDMDRPGQPGREEFVLDVTRALLDLAANEGYRICTLGEVMKARYQPGKRKLG